MSNMVLASGDDFPEAARKHLDDAGALLLAARYDGAAYLSGYVVECSLKSLLLLEAWAQAAGAASLQHLGSILRQRSWSAAVTSAVQAAAGHLRSGALGHRLGALLATAAGQPPGNPPPQHLLLLASKITRPYLHRGWARLGVIGGWRETIRYAPRGRVAPRVARAWFRNASAVHGRTLARMWADGVVF